MNQYIEPLSDLCWQAADAIMAHYKTDAEIVDKSDGSPLTKADLASHQIICQGLSKLTPDIPIISEESASPTQSQNHSIFWLVDPLDGTKEFINQNGEFTVNIALIKDGNPVMGFVCCPALSTLYYGIVGEGAFKSQRDQPSQPIQICAGSNDGLIIVGSRSHGNDEAMEQFLEGKKVKSLVSAGSSLKFCLVAEGKAHVYPRLGRTMEWDTAAGHAVLMAAGGQVSNMDSSPLVYGKPGLDNQHFVATSINLW